MADKKWTPHKEAKAIKMYIAGEDVAEIAKAIGMHKQTVRSFISTTQKALANATASKVKSPEKWNPVGMLRCQNPQLINEEFRSILSGPEDLNLTPEEIKFAHAYVSTNNYEIAAEIAGMDKGLFTIKQLKGGKGQSKAKEDGWHVWLKVRTAYLRMKPNIQRKIEELRGTEPYDTDKVNKSFLQKQIMIQIDALADSTSTDAEKLKRDYIQMLGRTFGGFTEKIEIGMIDHKKSVARLGKVVNADTLETLRAKKELEKQANGMD